MSRIAPQSDDKTTFTTLRGRRRQRLPLAVTQRIEELAPFMSAKEIHARISGAPELAEWCPTLRTIQRHVAELTALTAGETWTLAAGTGEEAASVLAILPAVACETRGRTTTVTRQEAAFLSKLAPVTRSLAPWRRYLLARTYALRQRLGTPAVDLDHFVGFAPWTDDARARAYWTAVALGDIPPAPRFLTGPRPGVEAETEDGQWQRALAEQEQVRRLGRNAARPYIDDALRAVRSDAGVQWQPDTDRDSSEGT